MNRKQKIIGVYDCGYDQIQLVARDGTGGEFYSCPEKGHIPRIKVGMYESNQWKHVIAVLLHEAYEFTMWRENCRYQPDNRVSPLSLGDYLFVMTHEQFHACTAKVADFIDSALPDLSASFNKWHKKARAKK